jgi:hypothetical protein
MPRNRIAFIASGAGVSGVSRPARAALGTPKMTASVRDGPHSVFWREHRGRRGDCHYGFDKHCLVPSLNAEGPGHPFEPVVKSRLWGWFIWHFARSCLPVASP